jgi:hypothetical protein
MNWIYRVKEKEETLSFPEVFKKGLAISWRTIWDVVPPEPSGAGDISKKMGTSAGSGALLLFFGALLLDFTSFSLLVVPFLDADAAERDEEDEVGGFLRGRGFDGTGGGRISDFRLMPRSR